MTRLGLVNGSVLEAWDRPACGDGVLIEGGRVAWIGQASEMPRADQTVDLHGATVGPGLTDAHIHLFAIASARLQVAVDRPDIRSVADMMTRLAIETAHRPTGEWAVATGFDENRLEDRRYPLRSELDAVFGGRPVLIRRFCGHTAILNSAALAALGLDDGAVAPKGGAFGRDHAGRLDGSAREAVAEMIFRAMPRPNRDALRASLRSVLQDAVALGLTAAVEAAVGFTEGFDPEWELWQELRQEMPDLPLRLGFMHQLEPAEAAARGLRPDRDVNWQAASLKFFADGIVGARTAAIREDYADVAGQGFFMRDEAELRRAIVAAHAEGWQVAVHAVGDRAVALVIECLEEAKRVAPRLDTRHRIEHAFVAPPDAYPRMKALGAVLVTQPSFLSRMNRSIWTAFGPRAEGFYQARSVLASGVEYVPSSDAPTGAFSPWAGAADAMDRGAIAGDPIGAAEALQAGEVLSGYARTGALAMGHETWRGSLRPGMAADLIAVDVDPSGAKADDVRRTQVLLTMVRGRIKHNRLTSAGWGERGAAEAGLALQ